MKIYVFAILVVAAVAFARNVPSIEDKMSLESLLANAESLKVAPVEEHHRVRRATCDLLDGLGGGHSFCAAHCIVIGYEGGYCNDKGVCVCRGKRRD